MGAEAILGGQYHCNGFYVQGNQRTAMAIDLVIEGSLLTGRGDDAIGPFTIRGGTERDGVSVGFEKHYATHTIEYNGTLVDGFKIVGWWKYPRHRYYAGAFELALEPINLAPLAEKALWKGHYEQFDRQYATAQELMIFATGRIQGGGHDVAGRFTIAGRFLEDKATMGPFLYTKKYDTYAISYEGIREGPVLTGIYQSPATGRGAFVLQDHSSRL